MIYIVIGGSCCGKTSFVKNTWLNGKGLEPKRDILSYVETDEAIVLGKYSNIDGRERSGTDTISRSQVRFIGAQVEKLIHRHGNKDIVLEGDKATSRKVFDAILELNIPVQLILLHCDSQLSISRHREYPTTVSDTMLKAMLTRSKNIFVEYKERMNGIEIDTSDFTPEDFKTFSLFNYKDYIKDNNSNKLF